MAEDEQQSVSPQTTNPLLHETHLIEPYCFVDVLELFHLPSPHITFEEMKQLRDVIIDAIARKTYDGVVITHGTDTLEETAYFLDITLEVNVPIVLTGAMRSSNEIGSDGLYNLVSAVRTAICPEAKGKGVMVVLNDEIHTAKNVTKTHASNVSTFQSPQYGPIGIVTKTKVRFHHAPIRREWIPFTNESIPNVPIVKAYAGMDDTLLRALEGRIDGLVVEALGQGNLPPKAAHGVCRLKDSGTPIVVVSRCFNGIAQEVYKYEGGGKWLHDRGIQFAYGLNGPKARIKLMLALAKYGQDLLLEDLFQE